MVVRVSRYLVAREKRGKLVHLDALAAFAEHRAGEHIERAFHTVFVEKLNEPSVLLAAIVIAERAGVFFALGVSIE
jgi:hypothetical protein